MVEDVSCRDSSSSSSGFSRSTLISSAVAGSWDSRTCSWDGWETRWRSWKPAKSPATSSCSTDHALADFFSFRYRELRLHHK